MTEQSATQSDSMARVAFELAKKIDTVEPGLASSAEAWLRLYDACNGVVRGHGADALNKLANLRKHKDSPGEASS